MKQELKRGEKHDDLMATSLFLKQSGYQRMQPKDSEMKRRWQNDARARQRNGNGNGGGTSGSSAMAPLAALISSSITAVLSSNRSRHIGGAHLRNRQSSVATPSSVSRSRKVMFMMMCLMCLGLIQHLRTSTRSLNSMERSLDVAVAQDKSPKSSNPKPAAKPEQQQQGPAASKAAPKVCNGTDPSTPGLYGTTPFPKTYPWNIFLRPMHGDLAELWKASEERNQDDPAGARAPSDASPDPVDGIDTVACAVTNFELFIHFPHTLQRILSCWSLWQQFPSARNHVYVMQPDWYARLLNQSPFNKGIFDMLEKAGIQFIKATPEEYIREYASNPATLLVAEYKYVTSFRMANGMHTAAFREKTYESVGLTNSDTTKSLPYCSPVASSPSSTSTSTLLPPGPMPRITILNRDGSRRLMDAAEISFALKERLNLPEAPPVKYTEWATFSQQVELFATSDILISPHGAQTAGLIFLPKCASLIEVFPFGYGIPFYFGSLSHVAGYNYSHVYAGKTNLTEDYKIHSATYEDRLRIRSQKVCVSVDSVVEAVADQIQNWRQCCGLS